MPILVSPTRDPLPPTHGLKVAKWMQRELVHGEGDLEGEPFRLSPHMLRVLCRWYEYDEATGLYLHDKALIGWPKGSAKTEFAAAVALEEVEGPAPKFGTPVVTIAAADGDQADELVRIAGMMVEDQPLAERLEVTNSRISQRGRKNNGRINSSTAARGKNDGKRTTLLIADELHVWDEDSPRGAQRHGILGRSTRKRRLGRQLNITTAGWSLESLAGLMYVLAKKIATGEHVDPKFLVEWWEASEEWDLEDPAQLVEAIVEANPFARLRDHENAVFRAHAAHVIDALVREYHEHRLRGEENDFLRYHLNRWVDVIRDLWMDMDAWRARANRQGRKGLPPPGTRIVLGFDGSWNGDSTALVGCTLEGRPYLFVVDSWERTENDRDWLVPIGAVERRIEEACEWWDVVELAADVNRWQSSLHRLEGRGVPVVEFPQSPKRMAAACQGLYEAVTRDMVDHDGDPRLTRHVGNARRHQSDYGVRIVKEHKESKRFIDLAVAAVQAHDRAQDLTLEGPPTEPNISLI